MKYKTIEADRYYHIYNSGNNKENIFKEERNYDYFLELIEKYLLSVCEIYAYCLLKNHFHLVLKTKKSLESKVISQKFSNMFNIYSKSINKAYDRSGSLFRDRFSRKRIDTEKYLIQLIIYVYLNPQHHKFVANFRNYKHSSYQSYLSEKPSKLNREFILLLFEGKSNVEYAHINKKIEIEESLTLEEY
ncbi:transposase [Aquimarina sp. RZ0]|uniref:transposase n=1 Tax=Aquimarina sp. RZ0 TaxID=2607730 RepID=UPI0011F1F14B|nr:transposase [Aquimarina sp. RZ0]KAA1244094.1 transposase [Aquimarina sp. RZ0]